MNAWLEHWTGLWLADPWLLLAALAVPFVAWLRRRRRGPALVLAPLALFASSALPRTLRPRLAGLPTVLECCALLLAAVALARPVEREVLPRVREGLDVLLALDVSSSMAARDLDPVKTRLELAKSAAAEFVEARPEDRIGLVTFARYADLLSPPTPDHRALQELLASIARVEPDGPEDATGIGTAVASATRVLAAPSESATPARVLILLTDGVENVASPRATREITPLAAARLAQRAGVRVYAITAGIGEPDGRGGFSPIDTSALEDLARLTGGRFFQARDAGALAGVYARIDELETVSFGEPRFRVHERFTPFVVLALAFTLCAAILRRTVFEVTP